MSSLSYAGLHFRLIYRSTVDVANSLAPSPLPSHSLAKGVSRAGAQATRMIEIDTSKQANIFAGMKFRSMEETARDTLADFARRGW